MQPLDLPNTTVHIHTHDSLRYTSAYTIVYESVCPVGVRVRCGSPHAGRGTHPFACRSVTITSVKPTNAFGCGLRWAVPNACLNAMAVGYQRLPATRTHDHSTHPTTNPCVINFATRDYFGVYYAKLSARILSPTQRV